jgi:hypothetical protein
MMKSSRAKKTLFSAMRSVKHFGRTLWSPSKGCSMVNFKTFATVILLARNTFSGQTCHWQMH